jgi:hypothetical protein
MSPLTLFLAKLIGSILLIVVVSMATRKEAIAATANQVIHDPGMIFLTGVLRLVGGLAIVLGHDVWTGGALPIIVTLFGWLMLVGGLMQLFTPQAKLVELYHAMRFEQRYATYVAITFLLGLYLFIAGFIG